MSASSVMATLSSFRLTEGTKNILIETSRLWVLTDVTVSVQLLKFTKLHGGVIITPYDKINGIYLQFYRKCWQTAFNNCINFVKKYFKITLFEAVTCWTKFIAIPHPGKENSYVGFCCCSNSRCA